jgi:hypothetical protein
MQITVRYFVKSSLAFAILANTGTFVSLAQSHPSGFSSRVLVLVQNPMNADDVIAPQYSLQIENATYGNEGAALNPYAWPTIRGWSSATPASIENLSAQGVGAVSNEDGSLSLINYATETVSSTNLGFTSPSAGTIVTQNLSLAIAANKEAGALTIIPFGTNAPIVLNFPGVSGISMNPGGTVILVFADDSNIVYALRQLSAADSQTYSGGNVPAGWTCGPNYLPTFCAIPVAPPGTNATTYSNQYFDHPFKVLTSVDGGVMYILNAGPEADGATASVTVLPSGPLVLSDGGQTGSIPSVPANYPVPGGVDDGIVVGSVLYVAGQQQVHPGQWAGQLTTINFTNSPAAVSSPQPMADGTPVRMALADDNTLWIGSLRCTSGMNEFEKNLGNTGVQGGCLTVVNTATGSVAYVEPYLCDLDTNAPCSGSHTPTLNYLTGGSGDITGIAPIPGAHLVYYVELGQVHVRSTVFSSTATGYPLTSNIGDSAYDDYNNVTVSGTAVDIVYMDSSSDGDGTSTSTVH